MIIHSRIHSTAFKILSSPFMASYNFFGGVRQQTGRLVGDKEELRERLAAKKRRGIIPCGIMPLPPLAEEKR